MNCQLARNRILAVEEPAVLPRELAGHLEECSVCQAWYVKYVDVDRILGSLPVPPADGLTKIAVLERIRAVPTSNAEPSSRQKSKPRTKGERAEPLANSNHKQQTPASTSPRPMPLNLRDEFPSKRRRSLGQRAAQFWPAGLIAASLLIGAVAWLSLRGNRTPTADAMPADPLLDAVVKLNVDLAKTQTPAERVVLLSKMAEELNQEMRDIARADSTGENMQALEDMYRKVVLNGLVAQAKLMDRRQREALLNKVAENLAQGGQKAEQKAAEAPQHSADSLRAAANTAREGTKRIRNLIKEAYS